MCDWQHDNVGWVYKEKNPLTYENGKKWYRNQLACLFVGGVGGLLLNSKMEIPSHSFFCTSLGL